MLSVQKKNTRLKRLGLTALGLCAVVLLSGCATVEREGQALWDSVPRVCGVPQALAETYFGEQYTHPPVDANPSASKGIEFNDRVDLEPDYDASEQYYSCMAVGKSNVDAERWGMVPRFWFTVSWYDPADFLIEGIVAQSEPVEVSGGTLYSGETGGLEGVGAEALWICGGVQLQVSVFDRTMRDDPAKLEQAKAFGVSVIESMAPFYGGTICSR